MLHPALGPLKQDMNLLERVWRRDTNMEQLSYEERLRELGLLNLKKRGSEEMLLQPFGM